MDWEFHSCEPRVQEYSQLATAELERTAHSMLGSHMHTALQPPCFWCVCVHLGIGQICMCQVGCTCIWNNKSVCFLSTQCAPWRGQIPILLEDGGSQSWTPGVPSGPKAPERFWCPLWEERKSGKTRGAVRSHPRMATGLYLQELLGWMMVEHGLPSVNSPSLVICLVLGWIQIPLKLRKELTLCPCKQSWCVIRPTHCFKLESDPRNSKRNELRNNHVVGFVVATWCREAIFVFFAWVDSPHTLQS